MKCVDKFDELVNLIPRSDRNRRYVGQMNYIDGDGEDCKGEVSEIYRAEHEARILALIEKHGVEDNELGAKIKFGTRPTIEGDQYLSSTEASDILGLHKGTISEWRRQGVLAAKKDATRRMWWYLRSDIEMMNPQRKVKK